MTHMIPPASETADPMNTSASVGMTDLPGICVRWGLDPASMGLEVIPTRPILKRDVSLRDQRVRPAP